MQRLLKSLEKTGALPPLHNQEGTPDATGPEAKLWILYYLAQHYDKIGQTGSPALGMLQMPILTQINPFKASHYKPVASWGCSITG